MTKITNTKAKTKPKTKKKRGAKGKAKVKSQTKFRPPKKMGRRPLLTKKIQNELVKVIDAGNYYVTACRYIGLPDSTFYSWIARGEDELTRILEAEKISKEEEKPRKSELIYLDFAEAIKRADASSEVKAVETVNSAFKDSWQAAMTFLERRHSSGWRRKERVEMVGDEGEAIQVRLYLPDNGRDKDDDEDKDK